MAMTHVTYRANLAPLARRGLVPTTAGKGSRRRSAQARRRRCALAVSDNVPQSTKAIHVLVIFTITLLSAAAVLTLFAEPADAGVLTAFARTLPERSFIGASLIGACLLGYYLAEAGHTDDSEATTATTRGQTFTRSLKEFGAGKATSLQKNKSSALHISRPKPSVVNERYANATQNVNVRMLIESNTED